MRRRMLRVDRFGSAEAVPRYVKSHYKPTIEAYRTIGGNPVLVAALDTQLVELAQRYLADGRMGWEYLLVTVRKR